MVGGESPLDDEGDEGGDAGVAVVGWGGFEVGGDRRRAADGEGGARHCRGTADEGSSENFRWPPDSTLRTNSKTLCNCADRFEGTNATALIYVCLILLYSR